MEPTKRARVINLIMQSKGANRIKFWQVCPEVILEIIGWGFFVVTDRGDVYERCRGENGSWRVVQTNRSEWLQGVANGMGRNDAGELVANGS